MKHRRQARFEFPSMRQSHLSFARQLRRQQTDAERLLWSRLRDHRFLSLQFRRQHPLAPYVLDFYCAELALAVELDGGQHADAQAHDQQRTDFLAARGLTVLRFWNNEVMSNLEGVLEQLRGFVERTAPERLESRKE
jgi:very-short-patch-repair endonuclease